MQRESMSPEPNFVRSLELCTNQFVRRLYKWDKLWFSIKSYWLTDQCVHLHGHVLSFSFLSHFYLNKSACFVGIYYKIWVIKKFEFIVNKNRPVIYKEYKNRPSARTMQLVTRIRFHMWFHLIHKLGDVFYWFSTRFLSTNQNSENLNQWGAIIIENRP